MRLYVNRLGHGHTNVFQRRWTCVIVRHRAITRATAVTERIRGILKRFRLRITIDHVILITIKNQRNVFLIVGVISSSYKIKVETMFWYEISFSPSFDRCWKRFRMNRYFLNVDSFSDGHPSDGQWSRKLGKQFT